MIVLEKMKVALLLMAAIFIAMLNGCTVIDQKSTIYENDAKIIQSGDSYTFKDRVGETREDLLNIEYNRFYGVQTIWTIRVTTPGLIKVEFESNVRSGDFKVILVTPNQELINIVEANGEDIYTFNALEGNYKIKIVGRNAYGNIKVEFEANTEVEVVVQDTGFKFILSMSLQSTFE